MFSRYFFIYVLISFMFILIFGITSFWYFEKMSLFDALWLTIVTIATVVYGDIVAHSTGGRIMTIVLIVGGIGLFFYVINKLITSAVEYRLPDVWRRKRMMNGINNLKEHIIVCGAGRVGQEISTQLKHEGVPFVVIEKNPALTEKLQEKEILHLIGDATIDQTLITTGIHKAKTVIITLPDDTINLFVTITCKDLNPQVRIITRATHPESISRLKRSGANHVIMPAVIAGSRMALMALKPASVAFVQNLTEITTVNLELEELPIYDTSPLAYQEIKNSRLREDFNTQLLAIIRNEKTVVNPQPAEKILPGDLLIVFGSKDNLNELEKYIISPK
ncbi:MAG TPA: hypothetical protein DCK87_04595 [Desulfotomaculum sp.]|nr:hypothetical protein [Desulfotomaculum sp.]